MTLLDQIGYLLQSCLALLFREKSKCNWMPQSQNWELTSKSGNLWGYYVWKSQSKKTLGPWIFQWINLPEVAQQLRNSVTPSLSYGQEKINWNQVPGALLVILRPGQWGQNIGDYGNVQKFKETLLFISSYLCLTCEMLYFILFMSQARCAVSVTLSWIAFVWAGTNVENQCMNCH